MTEEESDKKIDFKYEYEILSDDYPIYDLSFKLIVIGDSGVGKSSLTNKAVKDVFSNNFLPTVGFEFFSFMVKINDKILKLHIWDTCGQELYRSLVANFYKNCSLAILVYAIDNNDSFKNLSLWLKDLKINSNPDAKMILIGNKCDLVDERKISYEEGEKFSKDFEFEFFSETSAKTGFHAKEIFLKAAMYLYDDYILYKKNNEIERESNINMSNMDNFNDSNFIVIDKNNHKDTIKKSLIKKKSWC